MYIIVDHLALREDLRELVIDAFLQNSTLK